MASPPYQGGGSPPGPSPLALPRQRPALALPMKSRKSSLAPSTASGSAHPLRQTSFPPPDSLEAQHQLAEDRNLAQYSPGATSDEGLDDFSDSEITSAISGLVGDAAFAGKKRKRGEKGTRGRGRKGGPSRARTGSRKYLFREAVPTGHQNRYDAYSRVKLRTADVRKLVNATLSQSVPQNVVTVVGAYTKMFAGMLIEGAREAQAEWLAANPTRPDGGEQPAYKRLRLMQPDSEDEDEENQEPEEEKAPDQHKPSQNGNISPGNSSSTPNGELASADGPDAKLALQQSPESSKPNGTQSTPTLTNGSQSTLKDSTPKKKPDKGELDLDDLPDDFGEVQPGAWGLSKYIEECDRGPLLPDHLREALRRYKKSRAGGNVGFTGISMFGVDGRDVAAPRIGGGGKRMFR
ncbi:Transcription initiation factor TFIID subunit 11 [Pseudocercospora fuligena]|uniref:Transcription initiation factor TFIID subunit 11 n=1 Tax=Pseudocercospora fuligena TaxID=685502 RepID=A0A8H6VJN9_9PEZI|nr:Transcription initiation factor TFIID subunit 11 [Pseudocercospora fuligena]